MSNAQMNIQADAAARNTIVQPGKQTWAAELVALASNSRLRQRRASEKGSELSKVQESAAQSFLKTGFPSNREEAWKYTKPSIFGEGSFSPVSEKAADSAVSVEELAGCGLLHSDAPRMVIQDGFLDTELSSLEKLPKGVSFSLESANGGAETSASNQLTEGCWLGEQSLCRIKHCML